MHCDYCLEMSIGPFSLTWPDPPITAKILTRHDQLMKKIMMPKVEFLKYSINILHVVKFILKMLCMAISNVVKWMDKLLDQ